MSSGLDQPSLPAMVQMTQRAIEPHYVAPPVVGGRRPTSRTKTRQQAERPFMQEGPLCALMKTRKWADAEALILGEVAASNQGSKELVSRLVLEKDKEDRLPLHLACDLGAPTELVRLLLDHNDGAREEVEGEVFEAVVSSSQSSRMEEKERRLQSMIVDTTFKRDCMGRIPLHCAAAAGASADVITMLMDYPYPDKSCAIPEDPSNKDPMLLRETFYGKTPLELAQMKGHDATIKALGGASNSKFFMEMLAGSRSDNTAAKAAKKTASLKKGLATKK